MSTYNAIDQNGVKYLYDAINSEKVSKEAGKGLSTNDFTTKEKNDLANMPYKVLANSYLLKRTVGWTCKNYIYPAFETQEVNGVTFTNNGDGTVTVNGTATAGISFIICTKDDVDYANDFEGKSIFVNGAPGSSSETTYYLGIKVDNNTWRKDTGNGVEIACKSGATASSFYFYIEVKNGTTVDNKIFKPMAVMASVLDRSFEPKNPTVKEVLDLSKSDVIAGNPISLNGLKTKQLAIDPVITFEPIQAGSGDPSPSNIRAISGYDKVEVLSAGKNLIPDSISAIKAANNEITWNGNSFTLPGGATLTLLGDNDKLNSIKVNGTVSSQSYIILCKPGYNTIGNILKPDVYYTSTNIQISDNLTTGYNNTFTIRPDWHFDNAYAYFFVTVGNYDNVIFYPQLEEGQTATSYEQFHKTTDLSESLGQTVYGGTYNPRTGELVVDRGINDLSSLKWYQYAGTTTFWADPTIQQKYISSVMCDSYKGVDSRILYLANNEICANANDFSMSAKIAIRDDNYSDVTTFAASLAGKYAVTELETPFTIQLTPHEIALSQGYNYISSNGSNIALSYHNGELATHADVMQLGQTLNALGDVLPLKFKRVYLSASDIGTSFSPTAIQVGSIVSLLGEDIEQNRIAGINVCQAPLNPASILHIGFFNNQVFIAATQNTTLDGGFWVNILYVQDK